VPCPYATVAWEGSFLGCHMPGGCIGMLTAHSVSDRAMNSISLFRDLGPRDVPCR
jgi:hypothetical protein